MKHRGNIIASIRQCKGKGDQQECVQVVLLTVPCVSVTDGCQAVGSVCVCECECVCVRVISAWKARVIACLFWLDIRLIIQRLLQGDGDSETDTETERETGTQRTTVSLTDQHLCDLQVIWVNCAHTFVGLKSRRLFLASLFPSVSQKLL